MTDRLVNRIVDRHRRTLEVGLFGLGTLWHVLNDLPILLASRDAYRSFLLEAAAWCGLMAILCYLGLRLLATSGRLPEALVLAVAVLLLGTVAVFACRPDQVVTRANWAFGAVGWILLVVMARQNRFTVTAILLGPLATLVAVLLEGQLSAMPAFVIAGYAICALQLAVAVGTRAVRDNVGIGLAQARLRTALEIEHRGAEEALVDRRRRYLAMRPTTEPLLMGLAEGTLAPDNPQVQDLCAMEAARLRRLCIEGNNVLSPLLRDLYEVADQAERRGIRVELHSVGEVDEVPDDIRQALMRPAYAGLTRARSLVRVTVLATTARLTVAGVGDGPRLSGGPTLVGAVAVASGGDAERSWWEATWSRRTEPDFESL